MTSEEKLQIILDAADDLKAEQIETLNVRDKTSVADYFVVCSGTSDRHIQSIADKIEEKMSIARNKPLRSDGENTGWVLQDYGDVLVHVMRDEQRQFYDLETLWKNMKPAADIPED